jgi:hypothetical protein
VEELQPSSDLQEEVSKLLLKVEHQEPNSDRLWEHHKGDLISQEPISSVPQAMFLRFNLGLIR